MAHSGDTALDAPTENYLEQHSKRNMGVSLLGATRPSSNPPVHE